MTLPRLRLPTRRKKFENLGFGPNRYLWTILQVAGYNTNVKKCLKTNKSAKHNIVCLRNNNFDKKYNKEAHRYVKAWFYSSLILHRVVGTSLIQIDWKFSVEEATVGDCSNKYGTCHRRQSFIHNCQAEKTFIKKGYCQEHHLWSTKMCEGC